MKITETTTAFVNGIVDAFKFHDRSPENMLTENDLAKLFDKDISFTDLLPYYYFDEEHQVFELEDGLSVAAVHDIFPVDSEGASKEFIARTRDGIQQFINDSFKPHKVCPWVVEFYQFDESSLLETINDIDSQFREKGEDLKKEQPDLFDRLNNYRETVLELHKKHYRDVCKREGLFHDSTVTEEPWRGKMRFYRLVYYRRVNKKVVAKSPLSPKEELLAMRDKVESKLSTLNVKSSRVSGEEFTATMMRWFNPRPANRTVDDLVNSLDMSRKSEVYGFDLAEEMVRSRPKCDREKGIWYFNELPHTIVTTMGLSKPPDIGAISAPQQNEKKAKALFDSMPEGAYLSLKIVITDSQQVEEQIIQVGDASFGGDARSSNVKEQTNEAVHKIHRQQDPMYPVELCCYIRGDDEGDLRARQLATADVLENAGFRIIDNGDDLISWKSYLYNLPMAYRPDLNKSRRRSRLMYSQHIANLVPLLGRTRGTANFGINSFNRGGEPLMIDPLRDMQSNAHMTLFGPTGSGKSATMLYLMMCYIAFHNARIVIIESGNSFGEFAIHAHANGCTVNKVSMSSKDRKSTVPPFANALKALEQHEQAEERARRSTEEFELQQKQAKRREEVDAKIERLAEQQSFADVEDIFGSEDDDIDTKDYLGEMEIALIIMISGGEIERAKSVSVGDKSILRECLLKAAKRVRADSRSIVLTQDVGQAVRDVSEDSTVNESVRERFAEYANSINYFCGGLAGEKFNRAGKLWSDADITIVDMAEFAKDSKEGELAVSYMSILSAVNDIAEANAEAADSRPIIVVSDENHLFVKNMLLAKAVIKIVKMWRKLGVWYWPATQNIEDYSGDARVVLSLCEWWYMLSPPPDQVKQIAEFKDLTSDERALLASAQKQPKCYTEGVLLSPKYRLLTRIIPPSLVLAMAGTQKDERGKREAIKKEHSCSSPEANQIIAEEMDKARGIS